MSRVYVAGQISFEDSINCCGPTNVPILEASKCLDIRL